VRIVHLASGNIGGAKIAAVNLAYAQNSCGLSSFLISNDSYNPLVRVKSKITTAANRAWQNVPYLLSVKSSSQISFEKLNDLKPDLIHIHNWYNLLSLEDFTELGRQYPLVITLHDERIYTGGCHLTYACNNYLTNCTQCPAVSLGKSIISESNLFAGKTLRNLPKLGIISPSQWLAKRFSNSSIGHGLSIPRVIPNVIAELPLKQEVLTNSESKVLRVGFVSANLNQYLKNLNSLSFALEEIGKKFSDVRIDFHLVGEGNSPISRHYRTTSFGILKPNQMEKFWGTIDVLVVPSIIENFPTIIAEAAYHGIPVIASEVGGIPEMISKGWNGILSASSPSSLEAAIVAFLKMTYDDRKRMGENNRDYFARNFQKSVIVEAHRALYESVIAGSNL
jgi:glycosyltransferase involved in cell wall biosynthesis